MAETAELDVAPDTIEATLNYIVDDGNKVFTMEIGRASCRERVSKQV